MAEDRGLTVVLPAKTSRAQAEKAAAMLGLRVVGSHRHRDYDLFTGKHTGPLRTEVQLAAASG